MADQVSARRVLAVVLSIATAGVAALSLLQILGGIFFAYSFWYYVPPICTLAMLPTMIIPRSEQRLLVAYTLFVLFVLSYALRNWRDVELAAEDSVWLVIFPHALQLGFCLSILAQAHRRR
jgi:hypothetical protein